MIEEILIKQRMTTKKIRVIVYPTTDHKPKRTYDELTEASRKRLNIMLRKHSTRTYVRKDNITVWITR